MNTYSRIHKTAYYLSLSVFCLLLFSGSTVFAQKKKEKASKQSETVSYERAQSTIFADGLREFYSQNYSAANKLFSEVLKQNPKNDAAYYLLNKVAAEEKNFLLAAHYLKEAIKLDKKNEWYQIDLAGVYEQIGDFAGAVKIWEEICKVKYQNEYYLMALANNYLQLGKFQEVIKVYDKIENILGKTDNLTETKKNIWLYLNDVKSAVREYEKLLELYPYEISYYLTAGDIYLSNNMPDKAFPFFQKAMQIDAENGEVNLALYNYYATIKKSDEGFEALLKAFSSNELEIERKLPILKKYLTDAFRLQTNDLELLNKTVRLARALAEAHPYNLEGWAALAKLSTIGNQYQESKSLYEKCIELDESQFAIWEDYFYVLSKMQDYATIVLNKEHIDEYFPANASLQYGLALALYEEKQYDSALKAAKQALAFTFDNSFVADLNLLLGNISFELGEKEEAVKYWKTAQRRGKTSQELQNKIDTNQ